MIARLILAAVAGSLLGGGVGYKVVTDKQFTIDAQAVTISQYEERQTRVKAASKALHAAMAEMDAAEKGT